MCVSSHQCKDCVCTLLYIIMCALILILGLHMQCTIYMYHYNSKDIHIHYTVCTDSFGTGYSALMIAARLGDSVIVQIFIGASAILDFKEKEVKTIHILSTRVYVYCKCSRRKNQDVMTLISKDMNRGASEHYLQLLPLCCYNSHRRAIISFGANMCML